MKPQDKIAIDHMRMHGAKPAEIAARLHLSPNTVRSHIRRHPDVPGTHRCMNCCIPIVQPKGRREKKFCSDACRMAWWNSHQNEVNRQAFYTLTCQYCEKEFESYGNNRRKYCCRACYLNARKEKSI